MDRIEINVQTGERSVIPLTQAEIDAALARKAAEDAIELPKRAQEEADRAEAAEAKTIPFLNFLATKTNQQIRNRVQTLAVDQAGIVDVLEKLAIAVAVMARKELR